MSRPLEQDYIGLSEASSLDRSPTEAEKENVLNLKETELRLGLPGSESPERKAGAGVSLFGKDKEEKTNGYYSLSPLKNFSSGSKRGFSDAIDGSGKWVFSVNGGSEADLGKNGSENKNTQKPCLDGSNMKEVVSHVEGKKTQVSPVNQLGSTPPAAKAQVVGWPPVRSFRKNTLATNLTKKSDDDGKSGSGCLYVKVSMDGAPYLRKVDLKTYSNYIELSSALEKMFSCFTIGQCGSHGLSESHLKDLLHGSEYVLTYEDKDGDWMLVGDVPWEMFIDSCKRMRIMKGSEAIGLGSGGGTPSGCALPVSPEDFGFDCLPECRGHPLGLLSEPTTDYFKECRGLSYEWKVGGAKDSRCVMDLKRQKTVNPIWRPVCTQSSSSQDCSVKQLQAGFEDLHDLDGGRKVEDEIQVQEVNYSISSSSLDAQHTLDDGEAANEPADPILGSRSFQDNGQGRAPEGGSAPSDEKHSISVKVGASLMRFIKGKGGSTQKSIEEEIGVKIIFPSSKEEDFIIIEGISAAIVTRASERIQVIIDEAVKSPSLEYSHFISLPLAIHPELVDKLLNFQKSILGSSNAYQNENLDSDANEDTSEEEDKGQESDRGSDVAVKLKVEDANEHVKVDITNIRRVSYPTRASKPSGMKQAVYHSSASKPSDLRIEKSIFIKPKTIHLTVLMLKLWNKDRVDAAAEVLQTVSSEVLEALRQEPVSVRLKGLECMRGTLEKAHVVYIPVEEIGGKGRLSRACQIIFDAFVKAGLVPDKDSEQKLKLHATVMNARHRKWVRRTKKLDSFDARAIFKQFGSEEWGDYLIREAHLSQRFVYDENGYYRCCASIPFPETMQVD
ncbi:hypothetical protein RHMOL_Rhmol12G0235600 [Rhododendron molle]|uniref:Uncharacterized protein n=1 Tax=Rhododendron molle TaxID=49168 RepID=A0ACC0LLB4_RHOML|nr:hypothetical protein RHMOL_Rhmol12G0235600 [Rhododendron molle]